MTSLPSQFNLLTRSSGVFKTINNFLSEVATISSSMERLSKIEEYMKKLIEEKKKIEMFELPLANLLLTDAIEILEEACNQHRKKILEENNMVTWRSSSQLRTVDSMYEPNQNPCKNEVVRGAFLPFEACSTLPAIADQSGLAASGISLLTPRAIDLNKEPEDVQPQQQATGRKQRMYWSPVQHQRFVNCLEQLGGPQVATTKKILDMMQVDGLTYDEVKSHLQNFRLQIKRTARTHSGSLGSTSGSSACPIPSGNAGASSNMGEHRGWSQ